MAKINYLEPESRSELALTKLVEPDSSCFMKIFLCQPLYLQSPSQLLPLYTNVYLPMLEIKSNKCHFLLVLIYFLNSYMLKQNYICNTLSDVMRVTDAYAPSANWESGSC